MANRKTEMVPTDDLRPHPLNRELYGRPTENSAYKDIRADMQRRKFDERHPLLITLDRRIIWGTTRWAVAKSLKIGEVPCEVFVPSSPGTAELEIERELVKGNTYRVKTQVVLAREQRKLLELETALARDRMGAGSDGGVSKATDRVGKVFGESGKTVQRRLKVLNAIEQAEGKGDRRKADRLTELLEARKTVKALEALDGSKVPKKPVKVDVPRTLHDYATKAYGEFYEACCKVTVPAEAEVLAATLERMRGDLETARGRCLPPHRRDGSRAPT